LVAPFRLGGGRIAKGRRKVVKRRIGKNYQGSLMGHPTLRGDRKENPAAVKLGEYQAGAVGGTNALGTESRESGIADLLPKITERSITSKL